MSDMFVIVMVLLGAALVTLGVVLNLPDLIAVSTGCIIGIGLANIPWHR